MTSSATQPQHLQALALANETRRRRSDLRRAIRLGQVDVCDAILDPPEWLQTATVEWLLTSLSRLGLVKMARVCVTTQLRSSRQLGSLTERQRWALVEALHETCPIIMGQEPAHSQKVAA